MNEGTTEKLHVVVFICEDTSIFNAYNTANGNNLYSIKHAVSIEVAKEILLQKKVSAVIFYCANQSASQLNKLIKMIHSTNNFPLPIIYLATSDDALREKPNDAVFFVPLNEEKDNLWIVLKSLIYQNNVVKKSMNNAVKMFMTNQALHEGKFVINNIEEAKILAVFLGNLFSNRLNASMGIFELILNAIEHGNLKIGFDLKCKLIKEKQWEYELTKRLKEDTEKNVVEVLFKKSKEGNYIKIIDQGDGFEWKKYLDLDLSHYSNNCGRGIAFAKAQCFDKLLYNEKGNEVTAFSKSTDSFKW
jgi:hypothetical protein